MGVFLDQIVFFLAKTNRPIFFLCFCVPAGGSKAPPPSKCQKAPQGRGQPDFGSRRIFLPGEKTRPGGFGGGFFNMFNAGKFIWC